MILKSVLSEIALWKVVTILGLLVVSAAASIAHWVLAAHASRQRSGDDVTERLFPFGFAIWDYHMLRRSFYPDDAQGLYKWAVRTHAISLVSIVLWFALSIAWLVFKL